MNNIVRFVGKRAAQRNAERSGHQIHEQPLSPEELLDCAENLRDLMREVASSLEAMQRRIAEPK